MRPNTRTILSVIGVLVVAGCFWALVPAAPQFMYHAGAIAATPNEALSLRLYYTAPIGRLTSPNITSLVCDDQTQLSIAGGSRRWTPHANPHIPGKVPPTYLSIPTAPK